MKDISLDIGSCQSKTDFQIALRKALGAPDWHGWGLDAWWDSIGSDDINDVKAPYRLVLRGVGGLPPALRAYVELFAALFDDARCERNVRIWVELEN